MQEENSIAMSAEPTRACQYMYVTQCLFRSSYTKSKLETCKVEVQNCVHYDVQKRFFMHFKQNWQNS